MKRRGGRAFGPAQLLWLLIPALILVSLFAMRAGSMQASPQASALNVHLRISGYILAKNADQWTIDSVPVAVDGQTRIDESQYPANLGAFVGVTASHRDGQAMPHADVISVLRPASAEGTLVQLSGPLKTYTGEEWLVAGYVVNVSPQVFPGTPPGGSLVTIIAEERLGLLYAVRVEVVADNPNSIPVEFEGRITADDPDQKTWMIDGELTVNYGNASISGTPQVNDMIEIRARLASDGKLAAERVQVKGQPAQVAMGVLVTGITRQSNGTEIWTAQAFTAGVGADPVPVRLKVDGNTWVDRRRAQPDDGRWAEIINAELQADGSYHAAVVQLSQPAEVHLSGALRIFNPQGAPSTSYAAGSWLQVDGQTVWLPATAAGAASLKYGSQTTLNGAATVDGWRLGNGVIWAERLIR